MTPSAPIHSRFRVTVLGAFEVRREEKPLGASSWQRSVQTLLKLLVTSPEHRRLRDEVMDILWPDATPEGGASNLRYVLRLLRRHLGGDDPPPIVSDRSWITLNAAYSWDNDLARFQELSEQRADNPQAREEFAELYRAEPLMEDRYEDWAVPLRAHIQRTWQETCRRFGDNLRDQGELEAALVWFDRALAADPLDEDSFQRVLHVLIPLGRRAEAMKRYRQFEKQLRSELDLEPSPDTLALVSRDPSEAAMRSTLEPEVYPDRTSKAEMLGQVLPTGAYLGALPSAPLVARQEELSRVLSAVDSATEGPKRLILLAGEPGVGKTRLAQEGTRALHAKGFLVAFGRCYQPEQVMPYYPFLDVLAELYRIAPPRVREELPRRWPYLARLLPELQEVHMAAGPPTTETGGQDEPLLIRSIAGFLRVVANDQPLAILLDDLHWSDSASIKLLLHLTRHSGGSHLFLLGTYRDLEVTYDHPLHQALIDLNREGLMEKIALERLHPEATEALIAGLLGDAVLPPGLVDIIHRPTGGNPFFIQEVIRSMVEQGDLFQSDGRWARRQPGEIHLPESVRSVVGQRLSRLAQDTQAVLLAASVLGETFRFAEVERLSGRSDAHVESALEDATRAGLVRETHTNIYSFSHALAQQAVYAEMTGHKQQRLHLGAAETLEALTHNERRAAEIASHFLRAGNTERAIRYSILAGDAARQVFAHTEAEGYYRSAAESSREIGRAAQEAVAHEKLSATMLIQGRYPEAQESAQRAISLFQHIDDRDGEMRATRGLSKIFQVQGRSREGLALVRRLLDSREDLPTSATLVRLHLEAGALEGTLGEYEQWLHTVERARQIAQTLDDESLLVGVELERTGPLWHLGRTDEVLSTLRSELRVAEARDDPWLLLAVLSWLGVVAMYRGDLHAAEEYSERVVDLIGRIGDLSGLARSLSLLGGNRFLLGNWRQARANLEEALAIARSVDNAWVAVMPLIDLGHLAMCEGDWETGEAHMQEAMMMCESTGNLTPTRIVHLFLAKLDLLRGRPLAVIERLAPLIDRSGFEELQATPFLPPLSQAYLDLGDIDRADTLVTDALRRTAEQSNRLDWVAALLAQAAVREKQDRLDEARAALHEALCASQEMSFSSAEALALFRLGTLESRAGFAETAHLYLGGARDIFQRLGARKDMEQVDEALETVPPAG